LSFVVRPPPDIIKSYFIFGDFNMSQNSKPRSIIGPLNIYGLLALAGVVGPIILVIANLIASFSVSDYNPIRDSISSLAWTPMGWLQSIGFITVGLLVEVFTTGLLFSIHGAQGFRLGIALLVCFGFGLLLIGAFREDPVGGSHTIQGTIHTVTAAIVFSIFPIASLLIAFSIRKDTYWKGLFIHTIVVTGLASAFVIGNLFLPSKPNWLGLYERILVANTVIWIEIMAIRLLRLSLSETERLKRPNIF
jgi:hypothetical protein